MIYSTMHGHHIDLSKLVAASPFLVDREEWIGTFRLLFEGASLPVEYEVELFRLVGEDATPDMFRDAEHDCRVLYDAMIAAWEDVKGRYQHKAIPETRVVWA